MDTAVDQHRGHAGPEQGDRHQALTREWGANAADGRIAGKDTAISNTWEQDEEEEYINVEEAVDADTLSCGYAGTAAVGCFSESSSEEAAEEEKEEEMSDDIHSAAALRPAAACSTVSSTTPLNAYGDSATAAGDSVADRVACSGTGEGYGAEASLEFVLKGAQDALCCATVGTPIFCGESVNNAVQQQQNVGNMLLAALGSCDDACHVYMLPAELQEHLHPCAHTSKRLSSNCSADSSGRQKRTVPMAMDAAATLREGRETISVAAFSADSKLLACGCFDGIVRLYRPRVTIEGGMRSAVATAHSTGQIPDDVTLSRAPESLGLGIREPRGTQETSLQHAQGESSTPEASEASSPAAPKATEAHFESQIELSVELAEELRGCTADVVDLSFHPRGYALIVASADSTAWIWLVAPSWVNANSLKQAARGSGAVVTTVYAAKAPLTCCCFSSSGREGIVGAMDGTVSVFTAKTGVLCYSVKHPCLSLPVRHCQQYMQQECCSVVTLQLSRTCSIDQQSSLGDNTGDRGKDPYSHANDSGRGPRDSAAVGPLNLPDNSFLSKSRSSEDERKRHGDIILGVGYEDGWVALVREKAGDIIFAEQAHANKAVESVAFVRMAAGVTATVATPAAQRKMGPTSCYLFVSGGLDGRVVIWDVAHKCIRAAVSIVSAPSVAADTYVKAAKNDAFLQQEPMAFPGLTRLLVLRGERSHRTVCHVHNGLQQQEVIQDHQWLPLQQQQMRQLHEQQQQQLEAALICAGATDGRMFVMDVRVGKLLLQWQAHAGAIMDLTVLPTQRASSAAPEKAAMAVSTTEATAVGVVKRASLPTQQHELYERCGCRCYWRVLSAGDDGIGKVWRIYFA